MTPRARMMTYALNHMGAPYVWCAKGMFLWTPSGLVAHGFDVYAFDCSGLVTCAYFVGGGEDKRGLWNAEELWEKLAPAVFPGGGFPEFGAVACYGTGKCTHVGLHVGEGAVVCATGDETCTSPLEASKWSDAHGIEAEVHVWPSHLYRKDFLGWRTLPFPGE